MTVSKIIKQFLVILLSAPLLLANPKHVSADISCEDGLGIQIIYNNNQPINIGCPETASIEAVVSNIPTSLTGTYYLDTYEGPPAPPSKWDFSSNKLTPTDGSMNFTFDTVYCPHTIIGRPKSSMTHVIYLREDTGLLARQICAFDTKMKVINKSSNFNCDNFWYTQMGSDGELKNNPSCVSSNKEWTIGGDGLVVDFVNQEPFNGLVTVTKIKVKPSLPDWRFASLLKATDGVFNYTLPVDMMKEGYYYKLEYSTPHIKCDSGTFKVKYECTPEEQDRSASALEFNLCANLSEAGGSDSPKNKCENCLGVNENPEGIWTALGCIKIDPKNFISDFLIIAIGIAGGIALLLILYASFLISSSAGDPKKADEGKEIITGTIAGLLFIIFSVILLQVIGVEILQIPGL